jgi:glycosyltransferase involved in cell wall biosynthesis
LVYDTHELETEQGGESKFRNYVLKYIEKKFIKFADLIVTVSNPISEWYQSKYNIKRPPVILNVPALYKEEKKYNIFREKLSIPEDVTIILYQGGFGTGRGIELLLETFTKYVIEKTVIVFMGYGPLEGLIRQAALTNKFIFLNPSVSPDELLPYTSSADVGIHIIENTCLNNYYCLPNKLFEYLMAGIPVIVSNMQEMARIVKENNIGEIVYDYNSESVKEAIEKIKSMNYNELCFNVQNIKEQYSWETQEKLLIPIYRQLLQKKE